MLIGTKGRRGEEKKKNVIIKGIEVKKGKKEKQ